MRLIPTIGKYTIKNLGVNKTPDEVPEESNERKSEKKKGTTKRDNNLSQRVRSLMIKVKPSEGTLKRIIT
ncbi:unnamed protein product [Moneuplotes crassus]|uniref:Uncharacterized protein n=1 Tax=Euplotes crassus TaxID=5936 RepID=A0AAD1UF85_EUPCR|nr:unnamed protein product [Moneuplotes crassus]